MKKLLIIISLALILVSSCSKSTIVDDTLSGRWNYYRSYASNGATYIYTSTTDLKQWIQFGEDGKLVSNMPQFQKVVHYELVDSVKVRFTTSAPVTESHYYVKIDPVTHTLNLSSADYLCIEGCGDEFKR
jgi:hypothetical protein